MQKLGIKENFQIRIFNQPPGYEKTLGELPNNVILSSTNDKESLDFIQFFTKESSRLERDFPSLKELLVPNGALWISWPKGSSKIKSDLNENMIREIGLKNGLVDVKVCAVDEDWSGLKFVFRVKDRKSEQK